MATPPIVEVWLWDLHIASLAQSLDASQAVTFRYTDEFLSTGYELAPILMPASRQVFTDFNLRGETFKGLPPLVIDSLPDTFGEAIINQWLARQQRTEPLTPLERLCYVGARGMGALEYRPATPRPELTDEALDVQHLVELANKVVAARDGKMSEGLSTEKDFSQTSSRSQKPATHPLIPTHTTSTNQATRNQRVLFGGPALVAETTMATTQNTKPHPP